MLYEEASSYRTALCVDTPCFPVFIYVDAAQYLHKVTSTFQAKNGNGLGTGSLFGSTPSSRSVRASRRLFIPGEAAEVGASLTVRGAVLGSLQALPEPRHRQEEGSEAELMSS